MPCVNGRLAVLEFSNDQKHGLYSLPLPYRREASRTETQVRGFAERESDARDLRVSSEFAGTRGAEPAHHSR